MSHEQSTARVVAGKKLWKLCGDYTFAWSDLDDEERDHWIGLAQQVVAAYQKAAGESA